MKKLLPLLLAVLLLCSACGNGNQPSAAPTQAPSTSAPSPAPAATPEPTEAPPETTAEPPAAPAAFSVEDAQTLIDQGLFLEGLAELPDYTMVYGEIDASTVTDAVCWIATNTSVSADELTILVFTDEDAAAAGEEVMLARIESQLETSRNYTPAAVPRLEAAVVRREANTVLLAVGDPDNLEAAVEDLLS